MDDEFQSGPASEWTGGEIPSGLYVDVTREMPPDIESALLLLAQHAHVPADGQQHRITIDIVIKPDGHVLGAILRSDPSAS
jgi:hypothetical protein